MATYAEIQRWVKKNYGFTPKTCWIAHIKELMGLNPKVSPNRTGKRQHPCPESRQKALIDAIKNLK